MGGLLRDSPTTSSEGSEKIVEFGERSLVASTPRPIPGTCESMMGPTCAPRERSHARRPSSAERGGTLLANSSLMRARASATSATAKEREPSTHPAPRCRHARTGHSPPPSVDAWRACGWLVRLALPASREPLAAPACLRACAGLAPEPICDNFVDWAN